MPSPYVIRKWMGDDKYSWAVFARGASRPVIAGLSRSEARYHAKRLAAK